MRGRSGGGLSVAAVTRAAASVAVEAGDGVHRVAGVVATTAGALVGAVPCLTSGVAGHDAARGGDDGVRATQLVRARQVVCAAAPAARRHAVDGGVVEVLRRRELRLDRRGAAAAAGPVRAAAPRQRRRLELVGEMVVGSRARSAARGKVGVGVSVRGVGRGGRPVLGGAGVVSPGGSHARWH